VRQPVLFVSHGAPDEALRRSAWSESLSGFALALPRPAAVVVVSAHWETPAPVRVTSGPRPETIHDFDGFQRPLYGIRYPSPGSPEVAASVVSRLTGAGIASEADPDRGLDHGVWVPLRFLYPDGDMPVVAVSLPRPRTPAALAVLGRALSPLRDEGVLLVGSGGLVHNLRLLDWEERNAPPAVWAAEFETWVRGRLAAGDQEGLLRYREKAPHPLRAHPTTEHFDPLLFAVGAAEGDSCRSLYDGFDFGTLSMGCVAFGS
jgi:4,5-DOPA dioxygenase extradiol